MMPFKLLSILGGAILFFASICFFLFLFSSPKEKISAEKHVLKNKFATLLLEKSAKKSSDFQAYLDVDTPQCHGNLVRKQDDAIPAKAFFKGGDFQNGILDIYQPPTMGEAACKIELHLEQNKVIKAEQVEGDCEAWHGKNCGFITPTLGGMRLLTS